MPEGLDNSEVSIAKGIPNLLKLSSSESEVFTQQIENSNGTVRFWVHPFFNNEDVKRGLISGADLKLLTEQRKALVRLLKSKSDQILPIIILLEGGLPYKRGREFIQKVVSSETKDKIYVIPTYKKNPKPITSYSGQEEWDYSNTSQTDTGEPGWSALLDLLEKSGVKKVLLGGENLKARIVDTRTERSKGQGLLSKQVNSQFSKREVPNEISFSECIGVLGEILASKFKIEISHLSYPQNRKDINILTNSESWEEYDARIH